VQRSYIHERVGKNITDHECCLFIVSVSSMKSKDAEKTQTYAHTMTCKQGYPRQRRFSSNDVFLSYKHKVNYQKRQWRMVGNTHIAPLEMSSEVAARVSGSSV